MKATIIWTIVLIAVACAFILPAWASAQDGAQSQQSDALQPYKDWLWGVLDQGVRVTGGSECATVDGAQRCSFDFTLTWAE